MKDLGNLPSILDFNKDTVKVKEGKIKNINIKVRRISDDFFSVFITGSLQNYYNDCYMKLLSMKNSLKALTQLSETLGICIDHGLISRLDFARNFVVKQSPIQYLVRLVRSGKYTKKLVNDGQSLYFNKSYIILVFYDKIRESIRKGKKKMIPSIFKNKKVLRYELRLVRQLGMTLSLGRKELYVKDLFNRNVQSKLVDIWFQEYKSILKVYDSSVDMKYYKNFSTYLKLMGIESIGIKDLLTVSKSWAAANKLEARKELYLQKSLVKLINQSHKGHLLIDELDKKIKRRYNKVLSSI